MPEDSEFAILFIASFYTFHQVVHAQVLMVLGYYLGSSVVVEYKVLYIVYYYCPLNRKVVRPTP